MLMMFFFFFFFKQKTAYEITYGDWSSDVCSSDLSGSKIIASRFESNGSLPTSQSRGKFVESPGGKSDFFASRDPVPFTFGNPNRNGSHGGRVLTTHSTMCAHETMVRGELRVKAYQGF